MDVPELGLEETGACDTVEDPLRVEVPVPRTLDTDVTEVKGAVALLTDVTEVKGAVAVALPDGFVTIVSVWMVNESMVLDSENPVPVMSGLWLPARNDIVSTVSTASFPNAELTTSAPSCDFLDCLRILNFRRTRLDLALVEA